MATKDEGDQEGQAGTGTSSSSRARKADTSATAEGTTPDPGTDPAPGTDPVLQLGDRDAVYVADASEASTHRDPIVLRGPVDPADPGQQLVTVTSDQIQEFQHMGETRQTTSRMVMAAGTVTTRRIAEEAGITDYVEV